MTTQPKGKPVYVALRKPTPPRKVLSFAKAIAAAISANAKTFPGPVPSMAELQSAISALSAAEIATKSRVMGMVQIRDAKLAIVEAALARLRAYVEGVANADLANAAAVANAAGMDLRKRPRRTKNDVNVKAGKTSGTVTVTARVGTRAKQSHEWQRSTDSGKTWVQLPPTTQAKTSITGLTPGVTVLVRHRALTRTGLTAWTDAASMVVP